MYIYIIYKNNLNICYSYQIPEASPMIYRQEFKDRQTTQEKQEKIKYLIDCKSLWNTNIKLKIKVIVDMWL